MKTKTIEEIQKELDRVERAFSNWQPRLEGLIRDVQRLRKKPLIKRLTALTNKPQKECWAWPVDKLKECVELAESARKRAIEVEGFSEGYQ